MVCVTGRPFRFSSSTARDRLSADLAPERVTRGEGFSLLQTMDTPVCRCSEILGEFGEGKEEPRTEETTKHEG